MKSGQVLEISEKATDAWVEFKQQQSEMDVIQA